MLIRSQTDPPAHPRVLLFSMAPHISLCIPWLIELTYSLGTVGRPFYLLQHNHIRCSQPIEKFVPLHALIWGNILFAVQLLTHTEADSQFIMKS